MKKIEAIIRPSKLDAVRDALSQIGVISLTVEALAAKLKIAVVAADGLTSDVVHAIESAARN
jgi:nitrogen regulatory protein PII